MKPRTMAVLRRGIESALIASIPQVILPKIEERLFLREEESADLGPLFVAKLAEHLEKPLPEDTKWLAASAFHFGYATMWGAGYALLQERVRARPWVGGLALGALIHLITFTAWGGAVITGTEEKPKRRPWRREVVLATAPLVFGLVTGLLYGRGPKGKCTEW